MAPAADGFLKALGHHVPRERKVANCDQRDRDFLVETGYLIVHDGLLLVEVEGESEWTRIMLYRRLFGDDRTAHGTHTAVHSQIASNTRAEAPPPAGAGAEPCSGRTNHYVH